MPELPEVETIRRGLAEHVCGRTITDVAVHHPRAIRHVLGGEGEFRSEILGRTIIGLGRRGKFLWLNLADPAAATASASSVPTSQPTPQAGDQVVVVHLGMSGQMLIKDSNANSDDPKFKHCRIQVRFDDDTQLWFVDQRTFGYWLPTQLVDAGLGLVPETAD
ncbi:MAG: DNA-formamidopyrimidine glycosylase family protein, partial [Corynebacterium matruchotii]